MGNYVNNLTNGDKYDGLWLDDKRQGRGKFIVFDRNNEKGIQG